MKVFSPFPSPGSYEIQKLMPKKKKNFNKCLFLFIPHHKDYKILWHLLLCLKNIGLRTWDKRPLMPQGQLPGETSTTMVQAPAPSFSPYHSQLSSFPSGMVFMDPSQGSRCVSTTFNSFCLRQTGRAQQKVEKENFLQ